jgi:RNA-directed DNA polymerase
MITRRKVIMKREGNLFELIIEPENLRLAFWKAKKGKQNRREVIEYEYNLEKNLFFLREQLQEGTIKIGEYHYFKIYDPKERLICAASFQERVLHQAIMNICDDNFEKYQIYESYATRKGKGTHAAINIAKVNSRSNICYLKLDIHKYFDSIDHAILKKLLRRRFKDGHLIHLFDMIINSYDSEEGKGLPIGNLTSQYFANYYLAYFDHYVKEGLKIKDYVRYMDDMVIWDNDKSKLKEYMRIIKNYLKEELDLELNKPSINYTAVGLPFLGYRIYDKKMKLNNRSKKRFIRKLKLYTKKLEENEWSEKEYQIHLLPLLDFVQKAETRNLRNNIINKGIN